MNLKMFYGFGKKYCSGFLDCSGILKNVTRNTILNKKIFMNRKMFSDCNRSSRNSEMFINSKKSWIYKLFMTLKIYLLINIVAPRQCMNKNLTVAHNRSTFWHMGPQMQKPPYTGRRSALARYSLRHTGESQMCACARVRSEGIDLSQPACAWALVASRLDSKWNTCW